MLNTEFSPWPCFSNAETAAVQKVLASNRVNYWTGNEGREFEREYADWCGAAHGVAVANGTLALDVALQAIGIKAGDEVIVTPRTFIASVSCVVNCGAIPIFADVDEDSGNITAETIERVLTARTKAIICVHLGGWPCDMDSILALAEARGIYVIEDCAQAHGAQYKGKSVGAIGHIGAWSFCQDKIMTTGGEGGMVTTNDRDLWGRMWSLKDHGKSWEAVYEREHPPGFRWLHDNFGHNWRMLEIQAAIGRIQLKNMPDWSEKRRKNAEILIDALEDCSVVRVPQLSRDSKHAWYKFYAYLRPEGLAEGWSRDRVMAEINARGVPCYSGSCSEVYLEHAFDGTGWRPAERLPIAKMLGETSLMLLVHPTLKDAEISKAATVMTEVLRKAAR